MEVGGMASTLLEACLVVSVGGRVYKSVNVVEVWSLFGLFVVAAGRCCLRVSPTMYKSRGTRSRLLRIGLIRQKYAKPSRLTGDGTESTP